MDDLDLYEDLDEFHEQHEKKSKELQEAEDKYQQSLKTIEEMKAENQTLTKTIQRIELGFQSLLDTARSEIKRKDKEIERLRKEKDDILFRRKIPAKFANTNTDSQMTNNFSKNNPFKHHDIKPNESLVLESAKTNAETCEDSRQKAEKHKRNYADDDAGDRSDCKRHRGLLNDTEDKYPHGIHKQHNISHKAQEEYQSSRVRCRENNRTKLYEQDYGRNRSRDRHENPDSRFSYDKSSKSSERSDRCDKGSNRNRSRERDKPGYNYKNLKESGRSSRERHKTHIFSKSSSKSPSKRGKADASTKRSYKTDNNSIRTETENSKQILNKDLGEGNITHLKSEYKNLATEKLPTEKENRITNANSHHQTERIQKQEIYKMNHQHELPNILGSGFPTESLEAKSSEKCVLSTPKRLAIFNEIFGKSPSVCEAIPTSTNESIKGTQKRTSHIEVMISATTSPANYTDIDSDAFTPNNRTVENLTSVSRISCKTPTNEILCLERKSKDDINECFMPISTNSEKNFKTIGSVDLTNADEADMESELDFIQIPGLDLCPKRKLTKAGDNISTLIPIREYLETCSKETDITTQRLPKEKPFLVFNEATDLKSIDCSKTQLKEKSDIENGEDEDNNEVILIADDTATTDKIGVINELDKLSSRKKLTQSTDIIQSLQAPNCVEETLNKVANMDKLFAKEQNEITASTKSNLTNEVVVIDAKQCGGIVALKNPYKTKENEQSAMNSNILKKPEAESGVNVEIQVFHSSSEKLVQKSNSNERHIYENIRQMEFFAPGDSHPVTESNLDSQNEEIKLSKDVSNSSDISNVGETKSNDETFLKLEQVKENLILLGDEINPSLISKLPEESDKVAEGIEAKDNNEATGNSSTEKLLLNEKEPNEAKDKSKKDSKEEKFLNEEKFEIEIVSLPEQPDKEYTSKAEKGINSPSFRKKFEQDDSVSLSTEPSFKNDCLKQARSVTTKQPTLCETTMANELTDLDCPVSSKDQLIQNKMLDEQEKKTLGNDISVEILSQEENFLLHVEQETSSNPPDKYPKSDEFNKDNSAEAENTSHTDKLNIPVKVVELPALIKDKVIDRVADNFVNSSEKLTKNDCKVSNESSKIFVQSVEMLPPLRIVQNESLGITKGERIPSSSTSVEYSNDKEKLHKKLEIVKSSSQAMQSDEEELALVAEQAVSSRLAEIWNKIGTAGKEKSLVKETFNRKVQIVDLCSPIKTVQIETGTILSTSKSGDEFCATEKYFKDDHIIGERSFKKHSHVKDLTITVPNDKHLPQAKNLQTEAKMSITNFPPTESCPLDKSVVTKANLQTKEILEIEDENNLSENADHYCKSALHDKSLSKEITSSTESKLVFSENKRVENVEHQNKVVNTKEEIPDQKALEILSNKSTKNINISDKITLAEANTLCEETLIKDGDVDNSINEDTLKAVASIIVKSKQTEALQADDENLVIDKKENTKSTTGQKPIGHSSATVIIEDQVEPVKEIISIEEEGEDLSDSMEILLNEIHGIQDGHDNSIVLKVSDLDLTDEIKETSEETQTPSTDVLLATNDNVSITQNEQQNATNTQTLLLDMEKNDCKTETVNETLACPSTKTSRNSLNSTTYQKESSKKISCDNDITSKSKKDEGNGTHSFNRAPDQEKTEGLNTYEEIQIEVNLVKPVYKEDEDGYRGAIKGNISLNPKELKTCNQNQLLFSSEETTSTEEENRKSYETNKALYTKDSALAANCSAKESSPKDPSCKDLKKAQIIESTKTADDTEKKTENDLFTKETEPCSDVSTNLTEVSLNSTTRGLTINIPNKLEKYGKSGRAFPTPNKNDESKEFKDISVALPSKNPGKSLKIAENLSTEYEIESKMEKDIIGDKNVVHVANSCEDKEHISTQDGSGKSVAVNRDKHLQRTSSSTEIMNKYSHNQNESVEIGYNKFVIEKSVAVELRNDGKDKDGKNYNESNFKGREKSNGWEDSTKTKQINRSLSMSGKVLDAEAPKEDCKETSCHPLSEKEHEFKKVPEPFAYAPNPHYRKGNYTAIQNQLTTTGYPESCSERISSLQCDSNTQQINREEKVIPPLSVNVHSLLQSFADTKKIIYLKKVIAKEINMEGEIVEVVKDIIDFDATPIRAKMIKQTANILNKEQYTSESAGSGALPCGNEQNREQHSVSFECQKDVLAANLQESFPTLPSISDVFPTPSNFSGIFSKMPPSIAANEDELNKSKKKSTYLNAKRKEYILPAASVLCNVDNLENATKTNKKLHWELLDNKNEMTEIEDDVEIDTTDNEGLEREEKPFDNPICPPKQKNSETDNQTEDESMLNVRQQKGNCKTVMQSKVPKNKPKLHKNAKVEVKATAILKVNANVDDALPLQELALIFPPKRPVGRPRKLDKSVTQKKRGRKSKKIDESNVVESSTLILLNSKLDNYKKDPIELKENTENTKSVESSDADRITENLTTQTSFPKSSNSDGNYTDSNAKSLDGGDRNILEDLNSLENSEKTLSSSVEKLEISNEPRDSQDSFKQRQSFETLLPVSTNQEQKSSKDEVKISNVNELTSFNEEPGEKVDSEVITTVEEANNSEVTLRNEKIQNSNEGNITRNDSIVTTNDIPVSIKDRTLMENSIKTRNYIESSEQQQENFAKSKSLTKPMFDKKCQSISMKNTGKTVISLEDIGIKIRPPKVHLSSFRIPKIKKNSEDEINSGWKLEQYEELENVENKNQTQEKVTQERKLVDENNPKESCLGSTSSSDDTEKAVDKRQSKSNSMELIIKGNTQLQSETEIKETPKSVSSTAIKNYNTKTGRRKLYSADTYENKEADFGDKIVSNKQTVPINKTSQQDLVKNRRKSVSCIISKPNCDATKSTESCSKPLKKVVKSYRRILDSSSDEDITYAAKKIKLSTTNESNKTSQIPEIQQQVQTISRDLKKNETSKQLRMRSKSLYIERLNIEETDMQSDKRDQANVDPRISREQETFTNKLQLSDTGKSQSSNQQPIEAVKSLKMLKRSLNASKESPKQVKPMSSQASSQKNVQQSSIYVEHREVENKAEGKDSKREQSKDSTQQTKADSDLTVIPTHPDRLSKRRKSTNQKTNLNDNKVLDTTQRRIDPRLNLDADHNVKKFSDSSSEQIHPQEDIKMSKPCASHCQNRKPENNVIQGTPNEENILKQSREDHEVSTSKTHNISCTDDVSDTSAILTQQKDESITKKATANTSAEESKSVIGDNPKRRRRRVVKVLSTSMDSSNNSTTASQESPKQCSPFASPLLYHPIFNNEVSTQSSEFVKTLPLTPNHQTQDDSELKEINSKLNELFKSPIHTTENIEKNLSGAAAPNLSVLTPHLNSSQSTPGKNETLDVNRQTDCSSLNNSQLNNSSMPLNETQTLPEVKCLSMGSSNYRFEKVSDNVVNLFITRKRKRKC